MTIKFPFLVTYLLITTLAMTIVIFSSSYLSIMHNVYAKIDDEILANDLANQDLVLDDKQLSPFTEDADKAKIEDSNDEKRIVEIDGEPDILQKAEKQASQTKFLDDKELVDRIYPMILKRIDGPTLLKKIDPNQLVEKILPYVKIKITPVEGKTEKPDIGCGVVGVCAYEWHTKVTCGPDDGVAVGGSFIIGRDEGDIFFDTALQGDTWHVGGVIGEDATLGATVFCMKLEAAGTSGDVNQ